MTDSPDLDRRVTRLEQEMIEVRQDTTLANTLARDAGLEVSVVHADYRAHTQTLNALRETQVEHGRTLQEHSRTLQEHGQILHEHGHILRLHTELHREHSRILGEHSQMHRSHSRTLNALRDTQVDHSQRLDRLEQKVDHGFSVMSVGMAQITALLTHKLNEGEGEE